MEQWQILLLVALFALVRWIFRGGGLSDILGGGDEEQSPPTARRAQHEETEEERVRKFMEALGVPPTQTPPKRVTPPAARPLAQARREVQRRIAQKPVYVPKPAPTPSPARTEIEAVPQPVVAETTVVEEAYKTSSEFKPVVAVSSSPAVKGIDVRALLASPDSIRAAVILREVLGPPRSLQSFSATPNVQ